MSRSSPKPSEPPPETAASSANEANNAPPPSAHENWLLKLLLGHEEIMDWAADHLEPDWIQHPLVKQVVLQRLDAHRNQHWTSLAAFVGECEVPAMQNLITAATAEVRPLPNPAQQLADVALRLRNRFIDAQLAALMQRASQPEISEAEGLELLKQQQELRALKRQPLSARGEA
jgi:hypothetical protein